MSKKFYLIYQIINNVNGKIYIGKHITSNIDDNYFGSGKYLNRAKEKYGLENFTKMILFYCANEKEMNLLEKYVVTPEFCQRKDVYNIMEGGNGGWSYVNLSSDYGPGSEKRYIAHIKQFENITEADKEKFRNSISNGIKNRISNMSNQEREEFRLQNSKRAKHGFSQAFKGKHHSYETRKKISSAKQNNPLIGEKNGMFGKHWYHDPNELSCLPFNEGEQPKDWIQGKLVDEQIKNNWIQAGINANKGSITIYNSMTNELKRIKPNESVPIGFEKRGRPLSKDERKQISDTLKSQTTNNPEYIAKKIEFLRPRYQVYVDFGFEEMKKQFDYPYSLQNFSMSCKAYLPEYTKYARENGLKYKDLVSNLSSL